VGQALTIEQIETLSSYLPVGETHFLRDPGTFEVLEHEILPPLVASRASTSRTLRLWSAGCCTGEEAYSLAMICIRAIADLPTWNISILATDINPKFLAKAAAGIYSDWSFRGSPAWVRERFFIPTTDGKLAIVPAAKRMVQFGYLNLATATYPSLDNYTNAVDIIFCRNVLMYFTPEHRQSAIVGFHRCLVDGGVIIVSPSEAGAALFHSFATEMHDGNIIFRKATPPPADYSLPAVVAPDPWPMPVMEVAGVRKDATCGPAAPTTVDPASSPALPALARARLCANQGKLAEALTLCQQAAIDERINAAVHFLCATVHNELGQLQEAVAAFNRVLYLDPDCVLAHYTLGGTYRRLGKGRESQRHFAIALRLLAAKPKEEPVPESDGMTCGRLAECVRAAVGM